jgi:hypothetical protein
VAEFALTPKSSLEVAMTEEKAHFQPWQMNVVIILLAMLLGVALAHTRRSRQAPPQVKYEYLISAEPDALINGAINKLGAQGWELVFARRASVGDFDLRTNPTPEVRYEMIFRRPLP